MQFVKSVYKKKLTKKTPEQSLGRRSCVFLINSKQNSQKCSDASIFDLDHVNTCEVWENIIFQRFTSPVDTGRKLNVYKAFTRRPGCLLNDLYTFNLHLVSKGKSAIR